MGRKLSPKKKLLIFERDNSKCQYCGVEVDFSDKNSWHIDHVVPSSKGGTNCESNLKLACNSCNSKKRGFTLDYFRGMMSITNSKYRGIINYKQAEQLMGLGVDLGLDAYVFPFEEASSER